MITEPYQSFYMPDGEFIEGAFPTTDWFKEMERHISFENKTVLDLGCATFSYGIEAIKSGARLVTGIDNTDKMVDGSRWLLKEYGFGNASVYKEKIEDCQPGEFDIVIFSMIIHWLEDAPNHIKRLSEKTQDKLVFIYRYPYPWKAEPGFRPSLDQLDRLIGQNHWVSTTLMYTNDQYIQMVIYDKNP